MNTHTTQYLVSYCRVRAARGLSSGAQGTRENAPQVSTLACARESHPLFSRVPHTPRESLRVPLLGSGTAL